MRNYDYDRNPGWKKLRDESWGVRGYDDDPVPRPGDRLTLVNQKGQRKTVTIARVIFAKGPGEWIATIDDGTGGSRSQSQGRSGSSRSYRGGGGGWRGDRGDRIVCEECGESVHRPDAVECWECGASLL